MRYFLFFVCTLFVQVGFSQATWTATSGPYGGNFNKIQKAPNGNLFALSDFKKIFKSTDNGETWTKLIGGNEQIDDFIVDSDGVMYAINTYGFYTSTNEGNNWSYNTVPASGLVGITKVGNEGVIAVWGQTGALVTINKGNTWQTISLYGSNQNPALWANAVGDIFYASSEGLFRHPYHGLTNNWSTGGGNCIYTQVLNSPESGVYTINMTDDYGDGWQGGYIKVIIDGLEVDQLTMPDQYMGNPPISFLSVTINVPPGAATLAFEWSNDQYNSECGFYISSPSVPIASVNSPSAGPINLSVCDPLLNDSVLLPIDLSTDAIKSLTFDLTDQMHVSLTNNYYVSPDNGSNFTSINSRFQVGNTVLTNFNGVVGTGQSGTLYYFANNAYDNVAGQNYKAIYKSVDNGLTWSVNVSPTDLYKSDVKCVAFTTAATAFAGSTKGIFRSTNSGTSWVKKSKGLVPINTLGIMVANTTGRLIAVSGDAGYWTSSDGGATWSFISLAQYVSRTLKLANGTLIMYGNNYIYRSIDNGVSFSSDNVSRGGNNKILQAANGDLYSFYNSQIAKSTDSGATWVDLVLTGISGYFYTYQAAIDNSNNFLFNVWNGSANLTYKMVGTTASTVTLPEGPGYNNIFSLDDKFYVAKSNSYFYSSDLGATWTTVPFSGNYVFPIKKGAYSGVAVSKWGALYISQDEGKTWSNTVLPVSSGQNTQGYVTSIDIDGAGDFYASANGVPIVKYTNELLVDPLALPEYINFNWQPLNGPYGSQISRFQAHPNGTNFFAISYPTRKLWKSTGGIWTKLEPPEFNGNVWDVEIDNSGTIYVTANNAQILKSGDLGATWSTLTSAGLGSGSTQDLEVLSNGAIIAVNPGGILKSTDGGASFTTKYSGSIWMSFGGSFGVRPIISSSGVLAVVGGDTQSIIISVDNGDNWTIKPILFTPPIAGGVNTYVGSIMFDTNGNIVMHTVFDNPADVDPWYVAILKSTDNGDTWNELPNPSTALLSNGAKYSQRIAVLGTGEYLLSVRSLFDCYRSVDGGANWTFIGNIGEEFVWAETIGTTSYVFGIGDGGIYKTTDGGLTFTIESNGIPHPAASEIKLLNNKDIVLGATRPYYSDDFGQTFSLGGFERANKYLQAGDSLIGYGNGSRFLLKSLDGGKTWTSFGTDYLYFSYLTADATGLGYYGTDGGSLLYSTDLINWIPIALSGLPSSYGINGMVIDSGGTIFAVVNSGGSTYLYKIVFGSATDISTVVGTTNPATIRYVNNKIYLFDSKGIIYRSTNGNTWNESAAPVGNSLIPVNDYLFIPGSNSILWLSRDDGATWQSVGDTPPSSGAIPIFSDIVINELDGYAYATLTNSVAKKSGNIVLANDNTKPVAVSFLPANSATGVSLKPSFSITFDEVVNKVPGKKIRIFDITQPALPVETIDASAATQNAKTFTFTPTVKLAFNKNYFIVIDAGAFADLFGNTYNGISAQTTWTFTTKAIPTVVTLAPTNNATGVVLNQVLEVTFNEPVNGVPAKNFSVYKASDPTVPITTKLLTSGVLVGNTLSFTLNPGLLEFNTAYFVKLESSALTTEDGGVFSRLTTNTDWAFTTRIAPTVATLAPLNNATAVPLNQVLAVTFSEAVSGAPGKNLSIYKTSTPTTPVATLLISSGAVSGNTISFTLASGVLEYNTQYFVQLESNALSTALASFSALTTNTSWTFTTIEAPDTQKPSISLVTTDLTLEKGIAKSFDVTVTDNKILPTDQTKIWHRGITKLESDAFTSASMTVTSGSGTTSSGFTIAAQETWYDEMGLEFYIESTDAVGNVQRSPTVNNTYHYSYIKYPSTANPSITSGRIAFGGRESDYRVISIPFKLQDPQVLTILNELGGIDKTKWRIFTYAGDEKFTENPTNFERGKGYWINVKSSPGGILVEGATTPTNNKTNFFSINLTPGWNQVGNPYPVDISWEQVRAGNTASVGPVKIYNGTAYSDGDILSPYQGGFVFVTGSAISLKVRFKDILTGGRIKELFGSNLSEANWIVPISATNNEIVNEFGGVGMNENASFDWDQYDDINPPRFLNFAEIAFNQENSIHLPLSKNVVPSQDDYVWEFNTVSSKGTTVLSWNNTIIEGDKDLMLFDVEHQILIDMKSQGSYSFSAIGNKAFKVFFGKDLSERIKPTSISLGKPYPNPASQTATIKYTLPETQSTYTALLEVYSATGAKVKTLYNGNAAPGFYTASWNTENNQSGLYFYRLTVVEKGKLKSFTEKVIINK